MNAVFGYGAGKILSDIFIVNPNEDISTRTLDPWTRYPKQNVSRRDSGHHRTAEGYGEAKLKHSSSSRQAIRGQEQRLIDHYRSLGIAAEQINGISDRNKNRDLYLAAAKATFGKVT